MTNGCWWTGQPISPLAENTTMKSACCILVGELMYIAINTRPEISHVVNQCEHNACMLALHDKSHQGSLWGPQATKFSDILRESNICGSHGALQRHWGVWKFWNFFENLCHLSIHYTKENVFNFRWSWLFTRNKTWAEGFRTNPNLVGVPYITLDLIPLKTFSSRVLRDNVCFEADRNRSDGKILTPAQVASLLPLNTITRPVDSTNGCLYFERPLHKMSNSITSKFVARRF